MFENVATKGVIGIASVVLGYLYDSLNVLLVVLAMLMIVDYLTGMIAAFKTKTFNADVGRWGAVKKLCFAFLVLMGFLIDFVILYLSKQAGIELSFKALFGIAVTAYLIGTEGFSACQNLIVIGIPVPEFLLSAFGLIKDQSGMIVKGKEESNNGLQNNLEGNR